MLGLGFRKAPWGDSIIRTSSLTPLKNPRVLKLLGQGVPGEERVRGGGVSTERWASAAPRPGAKSGDSVGWSGGQGDSGGTGKKEGKKIKLLDPLIVGKCAELSSAVKRGASKGSKFSTAWGAQTGPLPNRGQQHLVSLQHDSSFHTVRSFRMNFCCSG